MKLITPKKSAKHGANLQDALCRFGGRKSEWIDLSSAVSPYSWWREREHSLPVPSEIVSELPVNSGSMLASIERYYGAPGLPVAGSQMAIQWLPRCFELGTVWVLSGTYGEHVYCWSVAGHTVIEKTQAELELSLQDTSALPDVLVIVNPGNPGGERFSTTQLKDWAERLSACGGCLVVDEAFMDVTPDKSLLQQNLLDNIVVLRSVGKFFGLAGLRFGVLFASETLKQVFSTFAGPWGVSGLSAWIVEQALRDTHWQALQQKRITEEQSARESLFPKDILIATEGLFTTVSSVDPIELQAQLAEQRVWVRAFPDQKRVRFGMIRSEDFERVKRAVEGLGFNTNKRAF